MKSWIPFSVILLIGMLFLFWQEHWPLHAAAIAFGHALVIAGVLGITVDRFAKDRLLKEAARDISQYLIGYRLPREIQDQIRQLMATDLVRTNCIYRYRLLQDVKGTVRLDVSVSYCIENFTSSAHEHVPRLALEKIDKPTIVEIGCHCSDGRSAYLLSGDTLTVLEDRPGVVRAEGRPILVQPRDERLEYRVFAKWSYRMPENHSDIMAFVGPTIGLTVEAEYPDEFVFLAQAASVETAARVWEYKRLFLPGQHVRVRWWPKAIA